MLKDKMHKEKIRPMNETLDSWRLNVKDHLIQSYFIGEQKSEEMKRLIQGHRARVGIGQEDGNKGTNSYWFQAMLCV